VAAMKARVTLRMTWVPFPVKTLTSERASLPPVSLT
jgi:hypothetical protein